MKIAIVHDYLTQRGGAERVVLSMLKAFPEAPLYTSLYNPATTFPSFREADIKVLPLNRIPALRNHHRAALPFLAPSFSALTIRADVVLCSSSGWSHGVRTEGRKIVYCYTPARWLYQTDRYLGNSSPLVRGSLSLSRPYLRNWDKKAASTADLYMAISTVVRDRISRTYGIQARLLPPPQTLEPSGDREPVADARPPFYLCVSRLLPYKNLYTLIDAFRSLPSETLVLAGSGPEEGALKAAAPSNVSVLGTVSDAQLRWLYANCTGLVAPSYEDLGLTTLEAAAFGKPSAALRWGGFLDTVQEGVTGVFFDQPDPALVAEALKTLSATRWEPEKLKVHASAYAEPAFIEKLRDIVWKMHQTTPGARIISPQPRQGGLSDAR